jgi:hypothetical protein
MSSIYAAGVRATALSNILTEIDANIITQSDGSLALDVQAMIDWATAQLYQMVTDAEATSTTYIGSLLAEVRTAVEVCAEVIAAGHWSARSDWPLHTSTASAQQSASVAGVSAQQGKLRSVAAAASAFYSDTPALMAQTIDDYFQSNVAPDIGQGVTLAGGKPRVHRDVRDGPRRGKRTESRFGADRVRPERHGDHHGRSGAERAARDALPGVPIEHDEPRQRRSSWCPIRQRRERLADRHAHDHRRQEGGRVARPVRDLAVG